MDLTPFAPERLETAFRGAPTPEAARERLELLAERIDRLGGEVLRRRLYVAAVRWVPALAEPVYGDVLDEIERSELVRRLCLWSVVEALARAVSVPPHVRERILAYLHTLPGVVLSAYPEITPRIDVVQPPSPEELNTEEQRALEASAVVSALVADRELPAAYLAALVPRAVRFSDPLTRIQIAEHPCADAAVWHAFLNAPSPADRALPGRVARAWANPEVSRRLRMLGDLDTLPQPARAGIRLRLCRAAPLAWARAWIPEVVRHEGLSALFLLAFDRPELATHVQDEDCRRILQSPDVRSVLRIESRPGASEPVVDPLADATFAELLAAPGAGFVHRLLLLVSG